MPLSLPLFLKNGEVDANGYCPISLVNEVSKIIAKVLAKQLSRVV